MALRSRFLLYRHDELIKIPQARFERFYHKGQAEFPEYAGESLKIAHFIIHFDGDKPVKVHNNYFTILDVDSQGALSSNTLRGQDQLAQLNWSNETVARNSNVVDATDRFLRKKLEHSGRWEPDVKCLNPMLGPLF